MGLMEVAGFYSNLKSGFDQLGVSSRLVSLSKHAFDYSGGYRSFWVDLAVRAGAARRSASSALASSALAPSAFFFVRMFWTFLDLLARCAIFIEALFLFDVFLFGFGSSFFRYRDLPVLKVFGKTIIYVFHGTDSRPPYLSCEEANLGATACARLSREKKSRILTIERYADVIISYPTYSHFHERSFVNTAHIGLPMIEPRTGRVESRGDDLPVRILHAPSHQAGKGTAEIRRAIAELEKRYALEYIELSGRPHAEVWKELAAADFIVDQVYSDTYMAGFATEAAFMGIPAVVGGYARAELDRITLPHLRPPVLFCLPDELVATMERLITDSAYRLSMGAAARRFALAERRASVVAERFLKIIEGDIPPDVLFNPRDIRYFHGWGMSESRVRKSILAVVEEAGNAGLHLEDKPEMEQALLKFAGVKQ